jgi:hypothetical protein
MFFVTKRRLRKIVDDVIAAMTSHLVDAMKKYGELLEEHRVLLDNYRTLLERNSELTQEVGALRGYIENDSLAGFIKQD